MNLSDLKPPAGQKHTKKRVGRGMGSGRGKTSAPRAQGRALDLRLQHDARI